MENHRYRENISDKGLRQFFRQLNNTPNKRYTPADYTRLRSQYLAMVDKHKDEQRVKRNDSRRYQRRADNFFASLRNAGEEMYELRVPRKSKQERKEIFANLKSLPIIGIKNNFEFVKNKFHIEDHTFKFHESVDNNLDKIRDIQGLANEASLKMFLKLMSYTKSNTYFRVFMRGEDKSVSTPISSFGEYSVDMFRRDIDKLQQSATSNSIFNIEFSIQLRRIPSGAGMLDSVQQFLKKRGITIIWNNDEKCGQRCLVFADCKTENDFKDMKKPARQHLYEKRVVSLCDELKISSRMSFTDFEKYATLRKVQVVILSEMFKQIYETETVFNDKVYLYYDSKIEHYHYIHNINSATNDVSRNSKWCEGCNKSLRFDTGAFSKHKCRDNTCYFCKELFESKEEKDKHFQSKCWVNCGICNCVCPNSTCLSKHEESCKGHRMRCDKCKKYVDKDHYENHLCGEELCKVCNIYHSDKNHRCFIKPLPKPLTKKEGDKKDVWCYDFESGFNDKNEHYVNYCVVMKLYSDEVFVCETMKEFVDFALTKKETTFIAHNGKAYDTWLVHKYLIRETNKRPNKLILAGNKIMYMKIKSIRFIDSLNHIAQPLSIFPEMFGLKELKKGYFPYTFNTLENKNYIGKIPDIKYFAPDEMMSDKRKDFTDWYNKQNSVIYDFKKELHEYCVSDVDILKKSMEIYISDGMELNGLNPIDCSTIAAYAMKVYRTNYLVDNKICVLKKDEYDFIKRGFFGGRTEVFQLHVNITDEELKDGKYINYIDIQSLYPTVQFYDELPCGLPVWDIEPVIQGDMKEYLEGHFGYIEVDVRCPNIHIPLLPEKKDMKLMFDLVDKSKTVYSSVELLRAIEIGYEITKVHKSLYFEKSVDLFKGYIQNFLKIKTECSGYEGDDVDEYIKRYYESCGVLLEKDKIKKNKGKKLLAKILLNSLWGKFGQKDDMPTNEYITDPSKWFRMLKKNIDGEIILKSETMIDENTLYIQYVSKDTTTSSLNTTNVGVAGFTTAQARLRLYKELYKLDDRVIYCDTDSIVYKHDTKLYNTQQSDVLGGWEAETKSPIIEFIGIAPKSYGYKCADGKIDVKCKGITLNYNNKQKLNFDTLTELVYGKKNVIETVKMEFIKDVKKGTITTKHTVKEISFNTATFKRIINDDKTTTARK